MGITIFPEKLEAIKYFEHTRQSAIELEEKLPQLKCFPIEKIGSASLEDNMKFCDMGEIEVARASDSKHILYTTDAASCIIIIACAYNSDGEYQQITAMTHDDSSGEFIAEELENQFGNQYHWKYYIAGGTPHVYERITEIYEELEGYGEQVEILGNLAFCNIRDLYFDVRSNKILSGERYVIENQNTPASQGETTATPATEAAASSGPMPR